MQYFLQRIVNEPEVLLLDEPLGALDLKLRQDMQQELIKIKNELGITFVFVTHDQEEALSISDRIVLMRSGVLQPALSPASASMYARKSCPPMRRYAISSLPI